MAELAEVEAHKKKKFAALYGQRSNHYQLERAEIDGMENEMPGPGHYFGPESAGFNAVGNQHFSKNRSEPKISMGFTGRDQWKKVFITGAHKPACMGEENPGPGQYLETEHLTTLAGGGRKIAKGQRFRAKSNYTISPGPKYDIRGMHQKEFTTVGKQTSKFTASKRFASAEKKGTVGPGQYDPKNNAINDDPEIGRSFGLGFSAYKKVICPGWETVGKGALSKGPGNPMWKDPAKNVRNVTISNTSRFSTRNKAHQIPGPGQYKQDLVNDEMCSALSGIPNPQTVKIGNPPKKPRFRQKLALECKNSGWGYF